MKFKLLSVLSLLALSACNNAPPCDPQASCQSNGNGNTVLAGLAGLAGGAIIGHAMANHRQQQTVVVHHIYPAGTYNRYDTPSYPRQAYRPSYRSYSRSRR